MKRKIFSKLLMVAMLVASVSMFVSCKDYDDDIKKNSDAISSLQQTLNNLQSALDQAKSDAATAHATFATKVELGQVDAAVKALQDEIKTLATKKALEDAIADVNSAIAKGATKEELETLSKELAAIDEKLAGDLTAYKETTDAAIETANKNIAKQEEALAALATLVATKADKTAVEEAVKALEAAIKAGDDKNATAISDLKTALEAAISEGDAANKKLIDALTKVVGTKADATALAAAVENLEAAIATKASQANLDKLSKTVDSKATIKSVEDLSTALTEQIAAAVEDIADINEKLETMADDINDVKDAMKDADDAVRKDIGDQINLLQAFLLKRLTSLVLKPSFYWEGLEGIEVPFLEAGVYAWKSDTTETYTLRNPMVNPGTKVTIKGAMGILQKNNEIYRLVDTNYDNRFEGISAPTADATSHALWAPSEYIQFENEEGLYENSAWKAYGSSTVGDSVVFISNGGVAYYHVNPATADLSGSSLSFFTNLAEVHTRYASDHDTAVEPKEKDAAKNKITNGIMEVPFKINNLALARFYWDYGYVDADRDRTTTSISDMGLGGYVRYGTVEHNDTLPFIALQCGTRDTIVTSDYAVLTPARYQIVALADTAAYYNGIDENTFAFEDYYMKRANHLDTVAIEAIDNVAIHPVAWNGQIDLKPFIQTHYKYWSLARYDKNTVLNEQIMDEATMEALGLHYEFYPITYTKGANGTDETAHITQQGDKTSGLFKANEVDDNGARLTSQNRNSIGREPLVRVDLVDEKGNIIEYGFIKLRIVDTVTTGFHVDINLNDIYMNCGDSAAVTWSQMENLILSKIGSNGITKQEFEEQYYLDVVKEGVTSMTDDDREQELYSDQFWARRYYLNSKGKYEVYNATGVDIDEDTQKDGTAAKYDLEKNWFGRVWYTPHDVDDTNDWDPQTNVLVWSFQPESEKVGSVEKGRFTKDELRKLMSLAKISYDSNGLNVEEVTTTVCFKKKNDKAGSNAIYVTLHFQPGKIHFNYASISNKDWSHWWQINTQQGGVTDVTKPYWKEFDVHANTPVPAANAYNFLEATYFEQDLKDYWKNEGKDMVKLEGEKAKFSKFYTEGGDPSARVDFVFVTPEEDLNSQNTTAVKGQWKVKGISGTEWTLELRKYGEGGSVTEAGNTAIVAVKKNGVAYGPEVICYLTNEGSSISGDILHFNGLEDNTNVAKTYPAATDLLNKSGRYDATGAPRYEKSASGTDDALLGYLTSAEYLEKDIDESFTAYLKAEVTGPCDTILVGRNYFNVRFMRPINVAPRTVEWKDIPNVMQKVNLSELIDIIDYRDVPVVAKDASAARDQVFYYGTKKFNAPKYSDVCADGKVKEQNKGVPYEFYGITDLAVLYDSIRTDHDIESITIRKNIETDPAKIVEFAKVSSLSSMSSSLAGGNYVLTLFDGENSPVVKDNWAAKYSTGLGRLEYTNNSGHVQLFHIYVPIAVKYNWGNIRWNGDKNSTLATKLDKDYTQVVWAVITVNPSE